MRALSESILKGSFIGLLLLSAVHPPGPPPVGLATACLVGGLALSMAVATVVQLPQRRSARGHWVVFFLASALESPLFGCAGLLAGLLLAAWMTGIAHSRGAALPLVAGGFAVGVSLGSLRFVRRPWMRLGWGLIVLLAVAGLAFSLLYPSSPGAAPEVRRAQAFFLFLGFLLFWLTAFTGTQAEAEAEAAIVSAGVGLVLCLLPGQQETNVLCLLAILLVYFTAVRYMLPRVRTWQQLFRGWVLARAGLIPPALCAYRRAFLLRPTHEWIRHRLGEMHGALNLQDIRHDRQMLEMVDPDLCLERIASLLLTVSPTETMLEQAHHLLDLAEMKQPSKGAVTAYWRAVAFTHGGRFEEAVGCLLRILAPHSGAGQDGRATILFEAWQLALTLHPELNRRVGGAVLELPGKRMEAIAAVERRLARAPGDAAALDLQRLLYSALTEAEYQAVAGSEGIARDCNHGYVQQLGLALIDDATRWHQGAAYLRLAARGLPEQAPGIYVRIAETCRRFHDPQGAQLHLELARHAGLRAGYQTLADEQRLAFFTAVRRLAEDARTRGDVDQALEYYRLLAESERSGLETLRALADLYEQKGDVIGALRATEEALVYHPRDADLRARKDRYYYSLLPADLPGHLPTLGSTFDLGYCLQKARMLLDERDGDAGLLDWAHHLAELALAARPDSLAAQVLLARALRQRGQAERSLQLLEDVYHGKPQAFASRADEEAWLQACRLLGECYLYEEGRPDLALHCLNDFRKSPRSGADTLYRLGQAYEQVGDRLRALRCYELVAAYDGHVLVPAARDALLRLRSDQPGEPSPR